MKKQKKTISQEDIESLLLTVETNAKKDRQRCLGLIADLEVEISDKESHLAYGSVVSKYMDGATRSNEQLMKVASLRHKIIIDRMSDPSGGSFSMEDLENIVEDNTKGVFDKL